MTLVPGCMASPQIHTSSPNPSASGCDLETRSLQSRPSLREVITEAPKPICLVLMEGRLLGMDTQGDAACEDRGHVYQPRSARDRQKPSEVGEGTASVSRPQDQPQTSSSRPWGSGSGVSSPPLCGRFGRTAPGNQDTCQIKTEP